VRLLEESDAGFLDGVNRSRVVGAHFEALLGVVAEELVLRLDL
jgi:hypothetical protein